MIMRRRGSGLESPRPIVTGSRILKEKKKCFFLQGIVLRLALLFRWQPVVFNGFSHLQFYYPFGLNLPRSMLMLALCKVNLQCIVNVVSLFFLLYSVLVAPAVAEVQNNGVFGLIERGAKTGL